MWRPLVTYIRKVQYVRTLFYVVASEQPAEHKMTSFYAPAPDTFSPLSNRFVSGQTNTIICAFPSSVTVISIQPPAAGW